jgi:penicillin-binding protein 1B
VAGLGLKLSLVGLVVLAGFAVYLDAVVQEKFSGKRWTIPAKVYARPLELFVGQKLSKDDFLTELDALGYRREPWQWPRRGCRQWQYRRPEYPWLPVL